jgi:hypothetical protein
VAHPANKHREEIREEVKETNRKANKEGNKEAANLAADNKNRAAAKKGNNSALIPLRAHDAFLRKPRREPLPFCSKIIFSCLYVCCTFFLDSVLF